MAKVTVTELENRVATLLNKMEKEGRKHKDYNKWNSSRDYYINKLSYMDEHDLLTIEL
tara:strand:- start:1381 stop:1554 length:174 start_codon:yes stop_codon:yes gene_type:complete